MILERKLEIVTKTSAHKVKRQNSVMSLRNVLIEKTFLFIFIRSYSEWLLSYKPYIIYTIFSVDIYVSLSYFFAVEITIQNIYHAHYRKIFIMVLSLRKYRPWPRTLTSSRRYDVHLPKCVKTLMLQIHVTFHYFLKTTPQDCMDMLHVTRIIR